MNLQKKIFTLLLSFVLLFSLSVPAFALTDKKEDKKEQPIDEIVMSYSNPNGRALCVAKYGNTRLYPENSIEGINSAISVGADIVTVSIKKTKDNKFVLLTDNTLKRMCVNKEDGTPATSKVSEHTLEQLQNEYYLREGNGGISKESTKYTIPSFEEAVAACKNKVMIMVNNGWQYAEELNALARKLNACDYIIIRNVPTPADAQAFISKVGVPVCHLSTTYTKDTEGSVKNFVVDSLASGPKLVELSAVKSYSKIFNSSLLNKFKDTGRAFISTTEQELCGGRDDLLKDWADLIERGYSVIETDYPKELASYISEIEGYRAELTSLIMQAEGLNLSSYTKESVKELTKTLDVAKETSALGCISLSEIDQARYDIQESLDDLQLRTGNEKDTLSPFAIVLIVVLSLIVLAVLIIFGLRIFNKKKAEKRKMNRFKNKFKNEQPDSSSPMKNIYGEEVSEESFASEEIDSQDSDENED